jgi:hypothetical protein
MEGRQMSCVRSVQSRAPGSTGTEYGITSNTLLIHGGRTTWEGNICYNDNHANFETRADPETLPFTFAGITNAQLKTQFDNIFVNENDSQRTSEVQTMSGNAANNTNNFLRMWVMVNTPQTFTSITPWFD